MINDRNILLKCPKETNTFVGCFLLSILMLICMPMLALGVFGTISFLLDRNFNDFVKPNELFGAAFIFIVLSWARIWDNGLKFNYITEHGLIIKSVFSKIEYSWSEITEFSKHINYCRTERYYYIKSKNKFLKIFITNSQAKGSEDLCRYIFKFAKNAKFKIYATYGRMSPIVESEWKLDEMSLTDQRQLFQT